MRLESRPSCKNNLDGHSETGRDSLGDIMNDNGDIQRLTPSALTSQSPFTITNRSYNLLMLIYITYMSLLLLPICRMDFFIQDMSVLINYLPLYYGYL